MAERRDFYSTVRISLPVLVPDAESARMNGFAWSHEFGFLVGTAFDGDNLVDALQRLRNPSEGTIPIHTVEPGERWRHVGGLTPPGGVDNRWFARVGKQGVAVFPPGTGPIPQYFSGFVPDEELARPGHRDAAGRPIKLRPDAAQSFAGLMGDLARQLGGDARSLVVRHYLSYDEQQRELIRAVASRSNRINEACSNLRCPAGTSDHGWGLAIDLDPRLSRRIRAGTMEAFGWVRDPTGDGGKNQDHWVFVGNAEAGWPAYVDPGDVRGADQGTRTAGTLSSQAFAVKAELEREPVRYFGGQRTLASLIFELLASEPLTIEQIAVRLSEDIQLISGTVSRLQQSGYVTSTGGTRVSFRRKS